MRRPLSAFHAHTGTEKMNELITYHQIQRGSKNLENSKWTDKPTYFAQQSPKCFNRMSAIVFHYSRFAFSIQHTIFHGDTEDFVKSKFAWSVTFVFSMSDCSWSQ